MLLQRRTGEQINEGQASKGLEAMQLAKNDTATTV